MILRHNFTLLELIIAAGLSAVVLTVISSAAWSTLQTTAACGLRSDMTQQSAVLIQRISDDLRGMQSRVVISAAELERRRADEIAPPLFFAESYDGELWLDMYTTAAITGPHMPAGIYRVSYRFDARDGTLRRRQAHIAQVELDALPWRVIGRHIESVAMEFFDGDEWRTFWDSNDEDGLPRAVEVQITWAHNGSVQRQDFLVAPLVRHAP